MPRSSVERVRVLGVRRGVGAEHALRLRVRLDERHLRLVASGEAQVVERHLVDREDRDRRAVLRTHVAERDAIGDRQVRQAGTEELDELADDALLAQRFGDREHEVGRRRAFRQTARQLVADDLRNEHRARLAEHRGLRLDPADAPADDAEAVDHRGVRIGAEDGIRIREHAITRRVAADDARQVLDVDLMDDARLGRHDAEVAERGLSPAQEHVPLAVAVVLELRVQLERVGPAEVIDLHRVIDDELDRLQRVHAIRVAAERDDAVAHGGEIRRCTARR